MTRTKYLALFAIISMIAFVMTSSSVDDIMAIKSQGKNAPGRVDTQSYGSANNHIVCGGSLCSECSGGYEQYIKDNEQGKTIYKSSSQESSTTNTLSQSISGGLLPVTHVIAKNAYF